MSKNELWFLFINEDAIKIAKIIDYLDGIAYDDAQPVMMQDARETLEDIRVHVETVIEAWT